MAISENVKEDMADVSPLAGLNVRKLAVFRALRLGDMLCAVPALRSLRAALPDACITLIGLPWAEQFARRFHTCIDDFVAFPGHPALPEQPVREELAAAFYCEMQERGFDLAIQMHGSGQVSNGIVRELGAAAVAGFTSRDARDDSSGFFADYPEAGPEPLRLLQLTRFLGAPSMGVDLEFPIETEDEEELRAAGLSGSALPHDYICMHAGASMRSKCWPTACFVHVADRLWQEFGLPIVLTGSEKERDLTDAIAAGTNALTFNAAAPISIGAMAALIRRSRLLVCNDTGVSHIAAAFRLPSVVIFSTADMQRWAPLDRILHRCISDPEGRNVETVVRQARELLTAALRNAGP